MSKSGITCYRNGGCGPYEMLSCSECPASKSDYHQYDVKKPQTNYDRLISKSPEELAEWLTMIEKRVINNALSKPFMYTVKQLKADWLDWLKGEVEE